MPVSIAPGVTWGRLVASPGVSLGMPHRMVPIFALYSCCPVSGSKGSGHWRGSGRWRCRVCWPQVAGEPIPLSWAEGSES
eukprot:1292773-Pyramimonas_sp.AAC.1